MTRLTYRIYRFASALAHYLPRRLTRAGLLVFGGLVLAGSVSFDMDKSTGSQAFAVLFCLLGTSLLSKRSFRLRFHAQRNLPRLASVGQPFRYAVHLRNLSAKPF